MSLAAVVASLFLVGAQALAYDCPSGASIDAQSDAEAKVRCDAFVVYHPRAELTVDPAISDRIPPQPPGNREVRSFALVIVVDSYPNFPEKDDQTLTAVENDISPLIEFLKEQQFDEVVFLHNEAATTNNITYFLRTYFLNETKIYHLRSRFLFAFDGHGNPGHDGIPGGIALTQATGEGDNNTNNIYSLNYLHSDLEAIAVETFHTVALLGSCYSGGIFPIDPSHGQTSFTFPKAAGAHAITASDPVHKAWTEPDGSGTVFYSEFLKAIKSVGENVQQNESTHIVDGHGSPTTVYDSIARLGLVVAQTNIGLEEIKNPTTNELYPQLSIGAIAPEAHLNGAFFFLGPRATTQASLPAATGSAVIGRPDLKVFKAIDRYAIRGIDLSHYSGSNVDFKEISKKFRFVYIKATQGNHIVDPTFRNNLVNSKDTTLRVGAYHFFDWCASAEDQFNNIKSNVKKDDSMLPFTVIVEWQMTGPNQQKPLCGTIEDTRNHLLSLFKLIENYYGKAPVLYTAAAFFKEFPITDDTFNRYPLWIADYSKRHVQDGAPSLPGSNPWTFWQFSDDLPVNIGNNKSSPTDVSIFFGSDEEFDAFANGKGNLALTEVSRSLK
ncbi:GH25 family lysozyme [Rhizobium rhizogenes]|uniref:Lysozyme n=1 Tax=Rhizobium rhizogenes NBRC 13257 TaxID=1220581 RepID=A0AA87Q6K8_RHIRH|nr:GH25 family lysozyme [Rhizobium rhizogenes]NTG71238.1 hypothetical protein [Rhizobium rhizogenes]NTG90545.1 hypothetical protein [Rhizobium rhizogenes]GAJ96048.1 hypothetical protein RRH01S_15_00140 [Rhizobium rhizogenes NBRC 13257]